MKLARVQGMVRSVIIGSGATCGHKRWRCFQQLAALLIGLTCSPLAGAAPANGRSGARALRAPLAWFDPHRPLTATAWVNHYLLEEHRISLGADPVGVLLERFQRPWLAGLPEAGWFERGSYGPHSWRPQPALTWNASACGQPSHEVLPRWLSERRPSPWGQGLGNVTATFSNFAFAPPDPVRLSTVWLSMEAAPEPDALAVETTPACRGWQRPLSVTLVRMDGEHDRVQLLGCDGSVSADTLDRVSVLLRPGGVLRPPLPLPIEPAALHPGEWLDGIKLAHPRLLWALARIAQAFPQRVLYLVSGYRREAHGYHPRGRAVDLFVHGVENEQLFEFCRTLNDVGCGYYPNNKFVHIDVREYGSHHPSWVDAAPPGEASLYVDSWPGVENLNATGPAH